MENYEFVVLVGKQYEHFKWQYNFFLLILHSNSLLNDICHIGHLYMHIFYNRNCLYNIHIHIFMINFFCHLTNFGCKFFIKLYFEVLGSRRRSF